MANPLELAFTTVDAFTTRVFSGNPAAIIVLQPGQPLSDSTMQLLAREFNLSETAFVFPEHDGVQGVYGLRWFTPTREVPLCGHATLAAAHVLFSAGVASPIRFETRVVGTLVASRVGESDVIELEFPGGIPQGVKDRTLVNTVRSAVRDALGLPELPQLIFVGTAHGEAFDGRILIHLDETIDLANATVNPSILASILGPLCFRSYVLTRAGEDVDFVSRMFAPLGGVPEDPVTGSAHSLLAPYWARVLGVGANTPLRARQVSPRGGELEVVWDGGDDGGHVKLRGAAVVAARGTVYVPPEH